MSVHAISWALKLEKTGGPGCKVTLFALADHAGEHGECHPSQATLARETEQSVDTVQRRLGDLERGRFIRRFTRWRPNGSRTTDLIVLLHDEKAIAYAEALVAGADPLICPTGQTTTSSGDHTADCGIPPAAVCGGAYRTGAVGDTATVRYPEPSLKPPFNQGRGSASANPIGRDRQSLDRIEALLIDAGGKALDPTSPVLCQLSPILNCLDQGCDLDLDVIPTVRELAARRLAKPQGLGRRIASWEFFTARIFEARDRRLAPPPQETSLERPGHRQPQRAAGPDHRNAAMARALAKRAPGIAPEPHPREPRFDDGPTRDGWPDGLAGQKVLGAG